MNSSRRAIRLSTHRIPAPTGWAVARWPSTSLGAFVLAIASLTSIHGGSARADEPGYRIASFSADVTIPLNHRCMGILPVKSKEIVDPLFAHGFVLLGAEQPIVLCAVDWCEIRNGAYDQWRDALARAAGTTRERVLLSALHQHDAPVVDTDAARLLSGVGLNDELFDVVFHQQTVERVADALRASLEESQPITHLGLGQSEVQQIASNRRIRLPNGQVTFGRGSRSSSDPAMSAAPAGQIDPKLKSLSFWNGSQALVVLHSYATHPMSYYGQGEVTSDFVGLARVRRQRDDFSVRQIYASGCSGDVTAGKYNDGSAAARVELTERLYQAMRDAWENTERLPLEQIRFRHSTLELPFSEEEKLSASALEAVLQDSAQSTERRIWAAMGLASRGRAERGQPIDLPCIDFGPAQLVLFPGESFVEYQLFAQRLRPDSFVMGLGYGECWPGYIPTESAFDDGFSDDWLWVGRGAEKKMQAAVKAVLAVED